MRRLIFALVLAASLGMVAHAQPDAALPPDEANASRMTFDGLHEVILRIDPDAVREGAVINLTVADVQVTAVVDEEADRMRFIAPVAEEGAMPAELFRRLLQADFDTALDARYAIAQGLVWATYIHPLSPLTEEQVGSGLAQTVNLVLSFGGSYSSGALVFGGGDSEQIYEDLVRELQERAIDDSI